jgi:hypothetical protein
MTDHTHPRPAAGSPVDCDVGRLEPQRDSSGPRGTYGCACRSRDARECIARRYPDLSAERCQCLCHDWSDEDDNLG